MAMIDPTISLERFLLRRSSWVWLAVVVVVGLTCWF
jgi:hypothetical protein